jgi:hypothetical protein
MFMDLNLGFKRLLTAIPYFSNDNVYNENMLN